MDSTTTVPRQMRRLGIVMEPNLADPHEMGGVLNPAAIRGPDGALYLLPRLVATGNYSRVGLARVLMDRHGNPAGVERLGVVLEPAAPYEFNARTGGGIEDPRVTYLPTRRLYVMTYTAYGEAGPRVAVAVSRDLAHWRRLGLVRFKPHHGLDMGAVDNKDALLFPEPVPAPDGRPAWALIHRPTFPIPSPGLPEDRPSMWISFAPLEEIRVNRRVVFGQHHLLASPQQGWEQLKVGGGAPPLRTPHGWLVLYHGVSSHVVRNAHLQGSSLRQAVRYSMGMLLLDARDPRQVLYRGARPILSPQIAAEQVGVVPHVVFPTGLDPRADGTLDVYYGMADSRIGVARVSVGHLFVPAPTQAA